MLVVLGLKFGLPVLLGLLRKARGWTRRVILYNPPLSKPIGVGMAGPVSMQQTSNAGTVRASIAWLSSDQLTTFRSARIPDLAHDATITLSRAIPSLLRAVT